MANYAVTDNGIVINIIVADSLEVAEEVTGKTCVEYTDENPIGINWIWSESANKYVDPTPAPEPTPEP